MRVIVVGLGIRGLKRLAVAGPDATGAVAPVALAAEHRAVCSTAYNHRFEAHLARVKQLLADGRIGRVYHCRMFCSNGTARDVRNSVWRDRGLGVIPDLASHMRDLCLFFGRRAAQLRQRIP